MATSQIVTRGFGSFAAVKYVPTRGFLSGAAPPPSTDGGIVPAPRDKSIFRVGQGVLNPIGSIVQT